MRRPRLYDLESKQFKDDLISDIMKDENGGVWYKSHDEKGAKYQRNNDWVVVWIDDDMDDEKLKSLLKDYKLIDQNIEQAQEELIQARKTEDSLKAAYSDGMPHGSNTSDPTYKAAVNILEEGYLIRFYACKVANLKNKKLLVEIMLDSLNETERAIIKEKYIYGGTWDNVSKKANYSKTPTRIKAEAAFRKIKALIA